MPSELILKQYGKVEDSLHLTQQADLELQPGQVRVQMKAAPINPADINLIEGKYPIPIDLPCVIGNEGAGTVLETADNVAGIAKGMTVITRAHIGSWCENRIVEQDDIVLVPNEIPIETASMLSVNPTTAWRMIHDFVDLEPGDWIIQNAANSAVGRSVIHFAKHLGLHTVNIVRREELVEPLKADGADIVLVEEERFSRTVRDRMKDTPIRLGLNAVGGKNAAEIAKSLAPKGCMVTFGAMGMQPLEIPNGLLIFKNISLHGFWLSEWHKQAQPLDIRSMFGRMFEILMKSPFEIPVAKTYPLSEYQQAIEHARQGSRGGKILFTMNP